MKRRHITAILLAGVLTVSMLAGCSSQPGATQGDAAGDTLQDTLADTGQEGNMATAEGEGAAAPDAISSDVLMIARQGMFSSGGTVTETEKSLCRRWLRMKKENHCAANTAAA